LFRRLGLAGDAPAPRLDGVMRGYVQHYFATAAALLVLVAASTLYVQGAVPVVPRPAADHEGVLVIGHRGAAGLAPQNTLPAFGDRVIVFSQHGAVIGRLRALAPAVPTAYTMEEARRLVLLQKVGLGAFVPPAAEVMSVAEGWGPAPMATVGLQRLLRDKGVQLYVGPVNDAAAMHRVIGLGAHGVITDKYRSNGTR